MRSARCLLLVALAAFAVAAVTAARADEEGGEVFSRHVRVVDTKGNFAAALIKVAPAGGEGWRTVEDPSDGFRIVIPASAKLDVTRSGSRVMEAVVGEPETRPHAVFRIDVFRPERGEPTHVDEEYAGRYADAYPEQAAFKGRFTLTDSGMVVQRKTNFAMVGGEYQEGAAPMFRVQWQYLSPSQQIILTFDCSSPRWEEHEETVARILLSFELTHRKGR